MPPLMSLVAVAKNLLQKKLTIAVLTKIYLENLKYFGMINIAPQPQTHTTFPQSYYKLYQYMFDRSKD